jgi:hypothetical protein
VRSPDKTVILAGQVFSLARKQLAVYRRGRFFKMNFKISTAMKATVSGIRSISAVVVIGDASRGERIF